jgi:MFS family permease
MLGLDAFLGEIPIILFSLLGGGSGGPPGPPPHPAVVPIRTDGLRLLLAALIGFGVVQVWHILGLSFVVGLAQAFGGPAYQAFIPTLVDPDDLHNAIALNSIQFNLARVIGPVLGGLALKRSGPCGASRLNGLSYVAVIITLLMITVRFAPPATQSIGSGKYQARVAVYHPAESMVTALMLLAFCMTLARVPRHHVPAGLRSRQCSTPDPTTYTASSWRFREWVP